MVFVGMLLGNLLDPIIAVIAGATGYFSRAYSSAAIGAGAAAILHEAALFSLQQTRQFSFGPILIALLASAAWLAIGYGIRRAFSKA